MEQEVRQNARWYVANVREGSEEASAATACAFWAAGNPACCTTALPPRRCASRSATACGSLRSRCSTPAASSWCRRTRWGLSLIHI